ncbi:MAG TPA: hypothetical protein VFX61_03335, partial [Micromonosporaceae bacterium]|nr:hypothetical protein [Micromonosporaceae bacterium]
MRVPTSVLLAVLAAAGLLALAPALVRRYDATERLVAERAQSTARVLPRRRRRRTVPGRRPVNPSRTLVLRTGASVASGSSGSASSGSMSTGSVSSGRRGAARMRVVPRASARTRRRPPARRHTPTVYRRR